MPSMKHHNLEHKIQAMSTQSFRFSLKSEYLYRLGAKQLFRNEFLLNRWESFRTLPVSSFTSSTSRTRSYSTEERHQNEKNRWNLSNRKMAVLEERLYQKVALSVMDPVTKYSLDKLGWLNRSLAISDDGTFQVLLKLPSMLHPHIDALKYKVRLEFEKEISAWLANEASIDLSKSKPSVNVEVIATKPTSAMLHLTEGKEELLDMLGPGLQSVAHFVTVFSCKGGVGKSTVAVNLAYELAARGGRVGLLDLDIYGPSLPLLVSPKDVAVRPSPIGLGMVYPITHEGVKLLSLGFVSSQSGVPGSGEENGAAVMRGPMVGKVVTQLLKSTDWGDLDVLVLDLPPGTGDVQLAVLQELQISGAVAVTTPSKLAMLDTKKGIEMFTSLGVPTIAVVENMSFFEGDGKRYFPFGKTNETNSLGRYRTVHLPISEAANSSVENGVPLCLSRHEESKLELEAFKDLADTVTEELLKFQYGQRDEVVGKVRFEPAQEVFDLSVTAMELGRDEIFLVRFYSDSGAIQKQLSPSELRSRDPKNGDKLRRSSPETTASDGLVKIYKSKGKPSPTDKPKRVQKQGRYGFRVEWADGATIIYSMAAIATASGGTVEN